MTKKERHIDINNLKRHQEFYALKTELEEFCDEMESINDIDLSNPQRTDLVQEILGRKWAADKVRDLLSSLGLVDKTSVKRDLTME